MKGKARRTSLGEISVLVTSGSRGWAEYYSETGPIFIRAQDIKTDRLLLEDIAHVSPPQGSEGSRTRTDLYDILVTITGANVTKSAILDRDIGESYVSQHVALVRLKNPADARFVHLWMVAPSHGRRFLESAAYGAGKPGLNLTQVRELPILLPTSEDQSRIVAEVDRRMSIMRALEATIRDALVRSQHLRQAVLRRAFKGQLVPQDPNDEPATLLLERLHSHLAIASINGRRTRGISRADFGISSPPVTATEPPPPAPRTPRSPATRRSRGRNR